jgi:hypothetical protein
MVEENRIVRMDIVIKGLTMCHANPRTDCRYRVRRLRRARFEISQRDCHSSLAIGR